MTSTLSPKIEPFTPLGSATEIEKTPGHWLLARLGKRVLRPGGIELTRQMLDALAISPSDDVIEFAPGLGATAKLTLKREPASYIGVERDERAAGSVQRVLSGANQRCVIGKAQETGLPDESASVIYGEAMLTMQSATVKQKIVNEAARLLRPGGRYGIHELAFVPDDPDSTIAAEISSVLGRTIHHLVQPLTVKSWRHLLETQGLSVSATFTAPMHLLEPARILRDEGLAGTLRFMANLMRDHGARSRVRELRRVFRAHRDHLAAVAIVAVRKDGLGDA